MRTHTETEKVRAGHDHPTTDKDKQGDQLQWTEEEIGRDVNNKSVKNFQKTNIYFAVDNEDK